MGISKKICPIFIMKYGDFLESKKNGDSLILKARVEPLTRNISIESGLNVEDIIKNQDGHKFKEIQYIGISEVQNGIQNKVISFTLNETMISNIKYGNIIGSQIVNNAIDTWISPDL
ncbi:MAG: hypothetical protein ACRCYC_14860 [Paraclostridium sp.]|uniref:hypothetical protein n=1 Tax=Paraclostridium sp. TaxID=2023273 RepID=UPI003F2AB21E